MAGRKSSYWSVPAVIGRVVWSHGGFKGAMRRIRRECFGVRTMASIHADPETGKRTARGVRRDESGWQQAKGRRARTYRDAP